MVDVLYKALVCPEATFFSLDIALSDILYVMFASLDYGIQDVDIAIYIVYCLDLSIYLPIKAWLDIIVLCPVLSSPISSGPSVFVLVWDSCSVKCPKWVKYLGKFFDKCID